MNPTKISLELKDFVVTWFPGSQRICRPGPTPHLEQKITHDFFNIIQLELEDLKKFTVDNLMKINESKTKIMLFNPPDSYDFPPELSLNSSSPFLDVVKHTKLLGLQISMGLRWEEQTRYLCKKANSKMWMLRRMKILNIEPEIGASVRRSSGRRSGGRLLAMT